jgi:hypothetical protein
MIVCDDHFLNDESMLKAMLRIFEKRITRTFRLRSISWVVLSLSFRRKTRDVCVCVCVFVCVFEEKMRIKIVVFKKSLYSIEFKRCLIFEIDSWINYTFVREHKKKEKSLLRWENSNIFYSISFFKHFFIQSYFKGTDILTPLWFP